MITLTSAMTNILTGATPGELGYFIYFDFDSSRGSGNGATRMSTFPYPSLTWTPPAGYSGTTWPGRARVLGLGQFRWSRDMSNTPLTVTLGAVDEDRFNDALNASRGRFATFWLVGYRTDSSPGVVADPIMICHRRMSPQRASSKDLLVELALESVTNRTRGRAIRKRTHADQQAQHPGDECLLDASIGKLGPTDQFAWSDRHAMKGLG